MRPKFLLTAIILTLSILISACGGDDKNASPTATVEPTIYAATRFANNPVGRMTIVDLTVIRSGPDTTFERENITAGTFDILGFDASRDYYEIDYNGELRWVAVSSVNIDIDSDSSSVIALDERSTRVPSATYTNTPTPPPQDRWGIAMIESYQDQNEKWLSLFPAEWQNPSTDTALYGVTVTYSETVIETCEDRVIEITRHYATLTFEVTHLESGERAGIRTFVGDPPSICEHLIYTRSQGNTVVGDLPADETIAEWLASFTTGESTQQVAIAPTATFTQTPTPTLTYTPSLTSTLTPTTRPEDRSGVYFKSRSPLYLEWKSAIPASWINDDLVTARYEIELTRTISVIENCRYFNQFTGQIALIKREVITAHVILTDVVTDEVISRDWLSGGRPEPCDFVEEFEYGLTEIVQGHEPSQFQFENWLVNNSPDLFIDLATLTPDPSRRLPTRAPTLATPIVTVTGVVEAYSSDDTLSSMTIIRSGTYEITGVSSLGDFISINYDGITRWILVTSPNIEIEGDLSRLYD